MPAERTPHADDSLLQAPLLAVTGFGLRAPVTVLVVATALALACLAVTLNGLTFKSSRLAPSWQHGGCPSHLLRDPRQFFWRQIMQCLGFQPR